MDRTILLKLAMGAACAILTALLLLWRRWHRCGPRRFTWEITLALVTLRLGLFVLLYAVMRSPYQSDVVAYHNYVAPALAGQLPYNDFYMPYAPPYPYLVAIPTLIWDSPGAIILMSIVLEIASLPVWIAVGRELLDETTVRRAAILSVGSVLSLLHVGLLGQNQSWMALAIGASLLLLLRQRPLLSGLVLGASLAMVKFLALLFTGPMWLAERRRWRWTLGFALLPALVYLPAACWIDIMHPVKTMGSHYGSGNIFFLLSALGLPLSDPQWQRPITMAGIASLVAAIIAIMLRGTVNVRAAAAPAMLIVLLVFVMVSKKSYPGYLCMALFPLCLVVARHKRFAAAAMAFLIFSTLAGAEASLYFRTLHLQDLRPLRQLGLASADARPYLLMMGVDLLLLAGYAWLLLASWRWLTTSCAKRGDTLNARGGV